MSRPVVASLLTAVTQASFLVLALGLGACSTPRSTPLTTGARHGSSLPSAGEALLQDLEALAAANKPAEVVAAADRELSRTADPELRARLLLVQAQSLLQLKRTHSALLALQRAEVDWPQMPTEVAVELLILRGDAELRRERPKEAARLYAQASALTKRPSEALRYRSYLAQLEAKDPAAESTRKRIIPYRAEELARWELALLDRKPAPPPPPVVKPAVKPSGLPDSLDELLPGIKRRKDWGAAPIRGRFDPMQPVVRLTVHHSTMPNWSPSEMPGELRQLQASHQNKWADLGYHFLIDSDGGIWEGRELRWQGAHEGVGKNRGSIGICLTGNFNITSPTKAQLASLTALLGSCRERFDLPASAVKTHQEVRADPTECPGTRLQPWVEAYRRSPPPASMARQ
ncbi:MAG: N-acetylmuramoyl-L-alanine amidase [Planctomycetota bacterium]